MKFLFYSFVPFLLLIILSGCAESMETQKEKCAKKGQTYKTEKKLNYRTGKYELRLVCVNSYQN